MSDTFIYSATPPRRRRVRLTRTSECSSPHDECVADLSAALAEIESLKSSLATAYDSIELQDLLLREIDHRAKNAFLTTAGLLHVQAVGSKNPLISGPLLAARTRLLALAAAHAALTDLKQGERLRLDALIRTVCENISHGLVGPGAPTALNLDFELAPVSCPAVQAMPLALLVSEALTNALKHAFPHGRSGQVCVRLWKGERDGILLSIADDGVGAPLQIQDGQGGTLMKRVARHLRADLTILKPSTGGMEVRMALNLANPAAL